MAIAAAVLSGFVLAAAAPQIHRLARGWSGWALALLPLLIFGYVLRLAFWPAAQQGPVGYDWVPSLGLKLSFLPDGLSLLFALLISGIGALVLIYAGGYLNGHPQLGRFYAWLLVFMASMLGLVLADNVLLVFVFWELTSLSSYLLIGFDHERERARLSALAALLVTGSGGLALLAGLLLLGQAGREAGIAPAQSLELSSYLAIGQSLAEHELYLPVLVLVLAGAFTKSAQFPFHFWLPAAMEAPTPVSAYLHSATMVKAGVYLLARLSPVLGGTDEWMLLVAGFGGVTMLIGAVLALGQTDLKLILAYSTVSALGMLTMLLGLGSQAAVAAAVTFLLAHALYKGALFLAAGAVDHETGTRDIRQLGGLARAMPLVAGAAVLAAVSMAGIAPTFGFIGKELVYEAALHAGPLPIVTASAAAAASVMFVAIAGIVGLRPFFGRMPKHSEPCVADAEFPKAEPAATRALQNQIHQPPMSLWLGPLVLAAAGVALGLVPQLVDGPLLAPAARAVFSTPQPAVLKLALWHGWSTALVLSIATVAGGIALYVVSGRTRQAISLAARIMPWGPARLYELGLDGLMQLARLQTSVLQSGYLRHYLLIIVVTAVGLASIGLAQVAWPAELRFTRPAFYEIGLAILIFLAILAAVLSRSRLAAIASLGTVGYGVALFFVLFGAPDVAMTQFLVETLTVILFVLVFYHLPAGAGLSSDWIRLRDAVVAAGVGVLMTGLAVMAVQVEFAEKISSYFLATSASAAHGRNVVNVILVDFRGLDTLGEITVLAVAATGVYALLKLRPAGERRTGSRTKDDSPLAPL